MKAVEELRPFVPSIEYVLSDIDDTLTDGGKLGAKAYEALWKLYEAGYKVIPVTGRPAGWCDLIIRQWPVEAVIGENGAFVYYREPDDRGSGIKSLYHPEIAKKGTREADPEVQRRLKLLREKVLREIPGTRVARDQFARQFDLAIDFREDPPDLGFDTAEKIQRLCEGEGAVAKISSIHVNAWFGNYDKVSMARYFLRQKYRLDERRMKERVLFCGDSPNDQPMFEYFPNSCAVANIEEMIDYIKHPPAFVTGAKGGEGFVEMCAVLLDAKS
ncbi:MAG TPA: HAD-IIB family hydrolase [Sediminispirochaeta sp.]|nr:HAD-IIB family hydrolase [Sediminispirochaeta sp.]